MSAAQIPDPFDMRNFLQGGHTEPPAEIREGAAQLFAVYTAFKAAGFSPIEAMQLVGAILQKGEA